MSGPEVLMVTSLVVMRNGQEHVAVVTPVTSAAGQVDPGHLKVKGEIADKSGRRG